MTFWLDLDRDGINWMFPTGRDGALFRFILKIFGGVGACLMFTVIAAIIHGTIIDKEGFEIVGIPSSRLPRLFCGPFALMITGCSWIIFFAFASKRQQVEDEFQRVRADGISAEIERVGPHDHQAREYKIRMVCDIDTPHGIERVRPLVTTVSFSSERVAASYLQRTQFPHPLISFNPDNPHEAFVLPWDDRQDNINATVAVLSTVLSLIFVGLSISELRHIL